MTKQIHIPADAPDEVAFALTLKRMRQRTVINENGCWVWTGPTRVNGYAQVYFRGKRESMTRLSYRIHKGEDVPADKDCCHTCDNRQCWNPDHLWAGTRKENAEDMSAKQRHYNSQKTVCLRGHPLTPDNVRVYDGCRRCMTCYQLRYRKDFRPLRRIGRRRDAGARARSG